MARATAGTLRNLANIRDPEELVTFEAEATLRRGLELLRQPIEMIRLLQEITDSDRINPLRRAIAFLEARGFKWNEIYIASTTPGQIYSYSGRLAGRDQDAFMMRTTADQVLIGKQRDISPDAQSGDELSFTASG